MRIRLLSRGKAFESGPAQHRIDVRKLAAARSRVQHGLAIAHKASLLLYAQRGEILRERAGVDRIVRPTAEDDWGQRTQRLGHVAVSPVGLANPEAEVRACCALQVTGRPKPQADAAYHFGIQCTRL